jgi:hypothetical protein
MGVVDDSFDQPLKLEENAVMPLAGGIVGYGYQCGMLWGASLAAGAHAYRLFDAGPQAETEAVIATQRLVESFLARNKNINCSEITELSWKGSSKGQLAQVLKFFLKGGPIVCFSMSAHYARLAYNEINSTLSEKHTQAPSPPVSCAALLAQKMGASEMHTVMAAGFAGGIGLSGGACGGLGAALWINGMKDIQAGDRKMDFTNDPKAQVTIDRYLESSDYEFECSKIVGRKFENVADHAGYLRAGGCSKIIAALAANGDLA